MSFIIRLIKDAEPVQVEGLVLVSEKEYGYSTDAFMNGYLKQVYIWRFIGCG